VLWSLMCYYPGCMDFNLVLIDCVHVLRLLLGFKTTILLFYCVYYLMRMIVLCLCCLSGVIKNNNNNSVIGEALLKAMPVIP